MSGSPESACFLDRDGVIVEDVHHLHRPEQLRLIPGAAAAIARLNHAGVPVIVVTNQSAVARGLLTESELVAIHAELDRQLASHGAHIDRYYHCPHHPTAGVNVYAVACACRKPLPGMLQAAARDLGVHLARSVMVGDKLSDIEAGARAGCRTVLVRTGYGRSYDTAALQTARHPPDAIADDLAAAVAWWCTAPAADDRDQRK